MNGFMESSATVRNSEKSEKSEKSENSENSDRDLSQQSSRSDLVLIRLGGLCASGLAGLIRGAARSRSPRSLSLIRSSYLGS